MALAATSTNPSVEAIAGSGTQSQRLDHSSLIAASMSRLTTQGGYHPEIFEKTSGYGSVSRESDLSSGQELNTELTGE
jgi:hypothetical protein